MALDIKTSGDKKYIIGEQPTFGTALADSIAGIELDCEPFSITPDYKKREHPGSHAARWMQGADMQTDNKGSAPTFTIAGPARNSVDQFMYSIFQSVTEGIATPWDKTFIWHATQPDFSVATTGHQFTVWEDNGGADGWKAHSALVQGLTLSCQPGEFLNYSADMRALGTVAQNSDYTGTAVREQGNKWHFEDIDRFTIDFGGGAQTMVLMGFEVNLSQEITPISPDGAGSFLTVALAKKRGTFSIEALFDANTITGGTNITTDTAITVNLGWGNAVPGTDDGDMDLTFKGKLENLEPTNNDTLSTTFTGDIVTTDATSPITVVMANGLDRTW